MSVMLACKEAIQKARKLGPLAINRVPDLKARGIEASLTPQGHLDIPEGQAGEYRALGAGLARFRTALHRQIDVDLANPAANAQAIVRMGLLVEKLGAYANCGELSSVAFRYIRRQALPGKVALVHWLRGNHEFVVAGLPGTLNTLGWRFDPDKAPGAWGNTAVWCDPWTGNCFDTWKMAPWSSFPGPS